MACPGKCFNMDQHLRSNSWFNFDPHPHLNHLVASGVHNPVGTASNFHSSCCKSGSTSTLEHELGMRSESRLCPGLCGHVSREAQQHGHLPSQAASQGLRQSQV